MIFIIYLVVAVLACAGAIFCIKSVDKEDVELGMFLMILFTSAFPIVNVVLLFNVLKHIVDHSDKIKWLNKKLF